MALLALLPTRREVVPVAMQTGVCKPFTAIDSTGHVGPAQRSWSETMHSESWCGRRLALTETAGDDVRHFPAFPQLILSPGDGALKPFVRVAEISGLLFDDGSLAACQHDIPLEIVRNVGSNWISNKY